MQYIIAIEIANSVQVLLRCKTCGVKIHIDINQPTLNSLPTDELPSEALLSKVATHSVGLTLAELRDQNIP